MKIDVGREACCSQDDQMGPLEMSFDMTDESTFGDLMQAVVASRFLQFSSTHTTLSCRIAGGEVARVFSPYATPPREPLFCVCADTLVRDLQLGGVVMFSFVTTGPGA